MSKKIEIELSDDLVNAYIPLSEAYDKGFKEGEKAGYIRGYDDACQVDCECGGENRYRAGRREVIEWIRNRGLFTHPSTSAYRPLSKDSQWLTQLKEWGE